MLCSEMCVAVKPLLKFPQTFCHSPEKKGGAPAPAPTLLHAPLRERQKKKTILRVKNDARSILQECNDEVRQSTCKDSFSYISPGWCSPVAW